MSRFRWLVCCALAASLSAKAHADVIDRSAKVDDTTIHYRVVLPNNFDPAKTYPGVLGFGGGSQDMDSVNRVIDRYFRDQAEKRGYIVIVPAAPSDLMYYQGGERNIFPDFLKQLLSQYRIQDNKFHAAGPSVGGLTAFRVAALNPQYFLSITAFPGYLREDTPDRLQAMSKLCVYMFVGEHDPLGWQRYMQRQAEEFSENGVTAQYNVEQGQAHSLDTLAGANATRLFDLFAQAQNGCGKNN
jgi:poly(3-hydroxybutyrate) depolymerase